MTFWLAARSARPLGEARLDGDAQPRSRQRDHDSGPLSPLEATDHAGTHVSGWKSDDERQ